MLTIAKWAVSLLSDKRIRKNIGIIIGVILAPIGLILICFTSSASAISEHNNAVIQTVFNQAEIPNSVPYDFEQYILDMQSNFKKLDIIISDIQQKIEVGSLDPIQVKSMFFAVYFGMDTLSLTSEQLTNYANCFVHYETIEVPNEDAEEGSISIEVAVLIDDITTIRKEISQAVGQTVTDEQIKNYRQIYKLVNLGADASTEGNGDYMSNLLKDVIAASENKPYIGGTPGSPFSDDWRNKITSEFGRRDEIILPDGTVTGDTHTGMDLGKGTPLGTPILTVADGEVVYVRNHKIGLGLHLAVDHGGGVITVYGHTSRILVNEGDKVKKGQKIAEVGSSGYSTGPHLHLEYWLHGKVLDPREYLH